MCLVLNFDHISSLVKQLFRMFSTVGRPTAISRGRHSAPVSTRRKRSGPVAYPGSVASRAHHAGFRIDLARFDAVGSVLSLSVVSGRTHQPHICLPLRPCTAPLGGLSVNRAAQIDGAMSPYASPL